MSGVDDRVVSMTFDNEQFERNLAATLESLDTLAESLNRLSVSENLTELSTAAGEVDLTPIEHAVDNISDKFSVMGAVAFSVIQDLTQRALDFARNLGSKVMDPLLFGGKKRAANLEQAKFLFEGLGMDIEASMASALKAVEGTAYGLDVAAKAAAQLGGSGLKAGDEMTGALRGIAGIAAMTNSSYEEMADVFTAAAGKGKVSGYELQRIGQRGVNAAAKLAEVWGTTESEVRRMATEGEISFKMFAKGMDDAFGEHSQKANQTYAGSLANVRAALSRIGATAFAPHMEQQRDLFNALIPVINSVHDALKPLINTFIGIKGSGIKNLIGFLEGLKFDNLKKAIQTISNAIINIHFVVGKFRDAVVHAFRDFFPPSNTSFLLKFAEAFYALTERFKMEEGTFYSIKSIFRGIFAAIAIGIEVIKVVSSLFRDLFESFAPEVKSPGVLTFFGNLGESIVRLKEALVDGGGIQVAVGKVVLFILKLVDIAKKIPETLDDVRDRLVDFKNAVFELFGGREVGLPGTEGVTDGLSRVGERMGMLENIVNRLGDRWQWLSDRFEGVRKALSAVWDWISNWFSELGDKLAKVMEPGDFDAAVDALNVGLLGGIAYAIKRFMDNGLKLDFGGGFLEKLSGIFEGLTGALEAMQTQLKAKALMQIAIAIGVLTAAIVILSMIDSAALAKSLAAISVGFAQLIGAMALLQMVSTDITGAKTAQLAASLIMIAGAMVVLSIAIKILSTLSWEELAKGLIGIGVALGIMIIGINYISANVSGMIRAGIAIGIIAGALNLLAIAVKIFATMSWEELAKGLLGAAASLAILIGALNLMPNKGRLLSSAAGMLIMSVALNAIALAVKAFASMDLETMGRGLLGMAGALTILMIALNTMPDEGRVLAGATGMLIMSVALNAMAAAVAAMGELSIAELAKGIGGIAVMLGLLSVALVVMSGTMSGSAALIIAAGALGILAGVLKSIGELSIGELITGLAGIAAVLAILGGAALILTPVIPALQGLGLALILIGGGFALFGKGVELVAKGFAMIAKFGAAGAKAFKEWAEITVSVLPGLMTAFAEGLLSLALTLFEGAGPIVKALSVLLGHILDTITENVPKLGKAFTAIIVTALKMIQEKFPEVMKTGYLILLTLMRGVRDNIYEITTLAVEILVNFGLALVANAFNLVDAGVKVLVAFLGAIASRANDIVEAGATLLIQLLLGISNNIDRVVTVVSIIIIRFIGAITESAGRIVEAGTAMLVSLLLGISDNIQKVIFVVGYIIEEFIKAVGAKALDIAEAGLDALAEFLNGITDNLGDVADAVGEMIGEFISAVGRNARIIITAGTDAVGDFLDGVKSNSALVMRKFTTTGIHVMRTLADSIVFTVHKAGQIIVNFLRNLRLAIDQYAPQIRTEGRLLAGSIIDGITGGLGDGAGKVAGVMGKLATGDILGAARKAVEAKSPSRAFYVLAQDIIEGLVLGLKKDAPHASQGVSAVAYKMTDAFNRIISDIPDTLADMDNFNPTITPVLDLTKIQKDSKDIQRLLGVSSIQPNVSVARAQDISTSTLDQNSDVEPPAPSGPSEVKFEQNIYAPKELSTNDIYRNTKSQVAMAKEELGIS